MMMCLDQAYFKWFRREFDDFSKLLNADVKLQDDVTSFFSFSSSSFQGVVQKEIITFRYADLQFCVWILFNNI